MAVQVTNYQCSKCTGPLRFDGTSGKLVCDYCGSAFDTEEIEALYAEKEAAAEAAAMRDTGEAGEEWGEEAGGMKSYSCPSCGAELICDATTAASSCPYCGNPTVVPGQFSGGKKPDYIIPFRLNKEAAVAALKMHYKGKILLPKAFTAGNHIEEIRGVYVPFWLFDMEAGASAVYDAEVSHTHKEGNYRVTSTDHYEVLRSGSMTFFRVPADGATKMPDDYMDSIEPFDYREMRPFSKAYLPGFLADKYDVDADTASERANRRCEQSILEALQDTAEGYTAVNLQQKQVSLKTVKVSYALLPVWMLSTRWKDKTYLFAMNGQTGRLVGDLPVDKRKAAGIFWGIAAGGSILLSLLLSAPLGYLISGLIS